MLCMKWQGCVRAAWSVSGNDSMLTWILEGLQGCDANLVTEHHLQVL